MRHGTVGLRRHVYGRSGAAGSTAAGPGHSAASGGMAARVASSSSAHVLASHRLTDGVTEWAEEEGEGEEEEGSGAEGSSSRCSDGGVSRAGLRCPAEGLVRTARTRHRRSAAGVAEERPGSGLGGSSSGSGREGPAAAPGEQAAASPGARYLLLLHRGAARSAPTCAEVPAVDMGKYGKAVITPRYVTVTFTVRMGTSSPKPSYVWSRPGDVDQAT